MAPLQIATVVGKIAATGLGFTVTILDVEAVQLLASVIVSVYVVEVAGVTVILEVVAELLQE